MALAGLLPIFAAHYLYAALYSETAFSLVMVEAVVLGALLTRQSFRKDLGRMRGLTAPAVLFALVLLVGLIQLTPWAPGGAHPVWAYIGRGPGSTTIDRSSTIAELIKLLGLACIFLVGALTGASDRRARTAVHVTLGFALLLAIWAFFGSVTDPVPGERRLEGNFLNANTAGTFMACMLMLSLAVMIRQLRAAKPETRIVRGAPLAAISLTFAICLLMTASRGATGALVVALLAFGALQMFSSKVKVTKALLVGVGGLIVVAIALLIAGDLVVDRFARADRDTALRTAVWAEHWQAFLASPLLGYGLGSLETVNKTLINGSNYGTLWSIKAVLNVYLQWLEQAGLLGAIAMFGTIAAIIVTTLNGALRRSRMTLLLFSLLAADVVFLVHGFTDFGLDAYSMAAMWSYLLGLQLALSQGSAR
ncbi:O-antigen ligase family protein [Phenylobacterium sp.]|uniref:O-antigen ligase family protein n=1 Tax=Phenylobacterium sp. TaxID=1871053 RepID=UPI003BB666AF